MKNYRQGTRYQNAGVLKNWPKIPKMPQDLYAQKVTDFDEKRLHWASLVLDVFINFRRKN